MKKNQQISKEETNKKYIVVANPGSYYHCGYWTGHKNKFSYDSKKALPMTHAEALNLINALKLTAAPSTTFIVYSYQENN